MAYSIQQMYDRADDRDIYSWDRDGARAFRDDLIDAIVSDYGFNLIQAQRIYDTAYDEGHASGYSEVVGYAITFADMVADCLAEQ